MLVLVPLFRCRSGKSRKRVNKANSIVSSSTTDDYLSASNMDSSDMEFYDVSDDEIDNSLNLDAVRTYARFLNGCRFEEKEQVNKSKSYKCCEDVLGCGMIFTCSFSDLRQFCLV